MHIRTRSSPLPGAVLLLFALVSAACEGITGREAAAGALEMPSVRIDSILPIDEEIRRFRLGIAEPATELRGGAGSKEELVGLFLEALERSDVQALASLTLDPAEFIDLYYPETHFTHPPYELSPGLVWFQLENYGSRGLTRALGRYGGRPLGATGHRCDEPRVEGSNRVWNGCVVVTTPEEPGGVEELSLFGAIVEREGRFKFVNYGNRL